MNGDVDDYVERGAEAAERPAQERQRGAAAATEPAGRVADPPVVVCHQPAVAAEVMEQDDVIVDDAVEEQVEPALDHNHNRADRQSMQQDEVAVQRPEAGGDVHLRAHWHPVDQPMELLQNRTDERRGYQEDPNGQSAEVEDGGQEQGASGGSKEKVRPVDDATVTNANSKSKNNAKH